MVSLHVPLGINLIRCTFTLTPVDVQKRLWPVTEQRHIKLLRQSIQAWRFTLCRFAQSLEQLIFVERSRQKELIIHWDFNMDNAADKLLSSKIIIITPTREKGFQNVHKRCPLWCSDFHSDESDPYLDLLVPKFYLAHFQIWKYIFVASYLSIAQLIPPAIWAPLVQYFSRL